MGKWFKAMAVGLVIAISAQFMMGFASDCGAVSYTHLDVYKRQVLVPIIRPGASISTLGSLEVLCTRASKEILMPGYKTPPR